MARSADVPRATSLAAPLISMVSLAISAVASRTALPSPLACAARAFSSSCTACEAAFSAAVASSAVVSGGQLLTGGRFADRFGHLPDGADDAAGADAYSWEVLH